MTEFTLNNVVSVINDEEQSASAIAKAIIGKKPSKKQTIELLDILNKLIDTNQIVIDESKRFVTYSLSYPVDIELDEEQQNIVDYVAGNPLASANSIAKFALNKSKASPAIKKRIDLIVKLGALKKSNNGRFDVYEVADNINIVKDIPNVITALGFEISPAEEKDSFVVKNPDGDDIIIKDDECLLIINKVPSYVVKTPNDVLEAIQEYTKSNNLVTFTVSNMVSNNQICSKQDICLDEHKIMALDIIKLNKAGK